MVAFLHLEANIKILTAPKNRCFWTVVLEKTRESPLDSKEIKPVNLKGNQSWIFIGRIGAGAWTSNTLATWCEVLTHLKRPLCWERLKAGGQVDDRGWGGWRASPTQWTWVWASSRSWWWTGKPDVLQSMGSQRVRYDWATELNWLKSSLDMLGFPGSSAGKESTYNVETPVWFLGQEDLLEKG